MKVLLVGGGGREHALAWKLAQSPLVDVLYAAPGNPGIARQAKCLATKADAIDALVAFAEIEGIDLTVVGPEAPLVAGLADRFAARGLTVFGPSARAAAIEGSKVFAKSLMARHGIPTARFAAFNDAPTARRYCRELGVPLVVKADGLAGGKGAIVCVTMNEADRAIADFMERRVFGPAGGRVVIEEFLRGEEVSFFALANGSDVVALTAAQDHKTVFDGDRGPNTGGMGAYSPVAAIDAAAETRIMATIVRPTIEALANEVGAYRGVLFVGLMLTADGPRVLEFNCRFGDPECQAMLVRMQDDLVPMLVAAARGDAFPPQIRWSPNASVCVTLAAGGYPGEYQTGFPITGLDGAESRPGIHLFHAGTAWRNGQLVTAGGRVLSVTATAAEIDSAIDAAYQAITEIHFEGMHCRRDVGRRAVTRR